MHKLEYPGEFFLIHPSMSTQTRNLQNGSCAERWGKATSQKIFQMVDRGEKFNEIRSKSLNMNTKFMFYE
jgi:hypothetical protein